MKEVLIGVTVPNGEAAHRISTIEKLKGKALMLFFQNVFAKKDS